MKNKVMISIVSTQTDEQNESTKMEFVTEGEYVIMNGKHYVSYEESEITGYGEDRTTLKVDGDTVTMLRLGKRNSQLMFRKGQHYLGHYETPYGAFTIGVLANKVQVQLQETAGSIDLEYLLDVNDAECARQTLHVEWK